MWWHFAIRVEEHRSLINHGPECLLQKHSSSFLALKVLLHLLIFLYLKQLSHSTFRYLLIPFLSLQRHHSWLEHSFATHSSCTAEEHRTMATGLAQSPGQSSPNLVSLHRGELGAELTARQGNCNHDAQRGASSKKAS